MVKIAKSRVLIDSSCILFGEEVGSGCFGKVYRGIFVDGSPEDNVLHIPVAIKTLKGMGDFVIFYCPMPAFKHPI